MPRKAVEGGKRYPLNMRTTKELRDRLEEAASNSGRSLAQEVEARLERSFGEERAIGGRKVHAIANLMTATFAHQGQMYARTNARDDWATDNWVDDPDCYNAAMIRTIEELMMAAPGVVPTREEVQRDLGQLYARIESHMINSGKWENPFKFEEDETDGR